MYPLPAYFLRLLSYNSKSLNVFQNDVVFDFFVNSSHNKLEYTSLYPNLLCNVILSIDLEIYILVIMVGNDHYLISLIDSPFKESSNEQDIEWKRRWKLYFIFLNSNCKASRIKSEANVYKSLSVFSVVRFFFLQYKNSIYMLNYVRKCRRICIQIIFTYIFYPITLNPFSAFYIQWKEFIFGLSLSLLEK